MKADTDISLLDLQMLIREGVEDAVPERVWVRAEVASLQAKGHCYMELCQSEDGRVVAKARAVAWKSVWAILAPAFEDATGSKIAPGMQILAQVQPSYSELYGLSLVIHDLEPQYTLGAAEMEKRKTIEKLEKDGFMTMQKELALPELPLSLAVISSASAAGFGDFCRHLDENPYGFKFRVQLFEALMQGEDAPASIAEAINAAQTESPAPFDAVLILRGGGSVLDLACFDDYDLAVAIANCPIPVVTAIGHDRDYHVADMIAHDYVKTPTALADLFIDAVAAEDEHISSIASRLRLSLAARLADESGRLALISGRLRASAVAHVAADLSALSNIATRLRASAAARLAAERSALDVLGERLRASDPRRALERGFALVADSRGVVVKSAAALRPGDRIRLVFADGSVEAVVGDS